jgi:hypothetical protein
VAYEGRRTWPRLRAVVHNLSDFYADLLPGLAPYGLLQALSRLQHEAEPSENNCHKKIGSDASEVWVSTRAFGEYITGCNQLCPTEALSIKESQKQVRFENRSEGHSEEKRACSWAQEAPIGLGGPAVLTKRADRIVWLHPLGRNLTNVGDRY